jgi:hypothetical protein
MNEIFRILLAGTLACACTCTQAIVPIITTVAGGGTDNPAVCCAEGDGGPATNAILNGPNGAFIDVVGNLVVADTGNNLIRKVSTDGIIKTVAGNGTGGNSGTAGYVGDGGPATLAEIAYPSGVAIDPNGNLYIADMGNLCVRKVAANGTIGTLPGSGPCGGSGRGAYGVALDTAGNLYIASNVYVYRVALATDGAVTAIAGGGYSYPGGPAPPYNGVPATQVSLGSPTGVAVDPYGNVFIAVPSLDVVCKVTPDGKIWTIAGNVTAGYSGDGGQATSAALKHPTSVTVDASSNLFIADQGNNVIREVTPDGIITTIAGTGTGGFSGDGGVPTNAQLYQPQGVFTRGGGILYITDSNNNRIRKATLNDIFKNGLE